MRYVFWNKGQERDAAGRLGGEGDGTKSVVSQVDVNGGSLFNVNSTAAVAIESYLSKPSIYNSSN